MSGEKFIITACLLEQIPNSRPRPIPHPIPFICEASYHPKPHQFVSAILAQPISTMLRTTILRSSAAAVRTAAMRPISSHAARRLAIAASAPRVSSFVAPKALAWQTVRCYASAGGLERKDVYDRIKQLLSGFDKVRAALLRLPNRPC